MSRKLHLGSFLKKSNNSDGVDKRDIKEGQEKHMQKNAEKNEGLKDEAGGSKKHNVKQSSSSCAAGVEVSSLVAECFLVASAVNLWEKPFICFMWCFVHT